MVLWVFELCMNQQLLGDCSPLNTILVTLGWISAIRLLYNKIQNVSKTAMELFLFNTLFLLPVFLLS